jgi:hypothetical protein
MHQHIQTKSHKVTKSIAKKFITYVIETFADKIPINMKQGKLVEM